MTDVEKEKFCSKISSISVDEVVKMRNSYMVGSHKWDLLNTLKTVKLLNEKPSTNENIYYFDDDDLEQIFSSDIMEEDIEYVSMLKNIKPKIGMRAQLEYDKRYRQIVTCAVIKTVDGKYLLLGKDEKTTELRLRNSLGIPAGHLNSKFPYVTFDNMMCELNEEIGLKPSDINHIRRLCLLKPNMKNPDSISNEHFFIIYEIDVNDVKITPREEDLTCIYYDIHEINDKLELLDDVCQLVFKYIIEKSK